MPPTNNSRISWSDVSEAIAGLIIAGKISPAAVRPDSVTEPFPALVKLYQKAGKKAPGVNDIMRCVGPVAYNTATNAAQQAKGIPADWAKLADQLAIKHDTAQLFEKFSRQLYAGADVDMSLIHSSMGRLESRQHMLTQASTVDDKGEDNIPSGYEPYDTYFGGLADSSLNIIAGPPGSGKTWHAIQVAGAYLKKYPTRRVNYYSLEMTNAQIVRRAKGKLKFPKSVLQRMYICEEPVNIYELVSIDSREDADIDGLTIVDFAELVMDGENSSANEQAMSAVAWGLSRYAKRRKRPVMLVSQLSRRYDGTLPTLTMLRYSGALEQAAATVRFLYNPTQVMVASDTRGILPLVNGRGYIIDAKERYGFKMGGMGAVQVDWNGIGWGDVGHEWFPVTL